MSVFSTDQGPFTGLKQIRKKIAEMIYDSYKYVAAVQ